MHIREELPSDRDAVHALNRAAFGTNAEADLVDALRREAHPIVSLVAEDHGTLVGHILFTPVAVGGHHGLKLMGLAPMAVAPASQRVGTGSALVRAGLEACRRLGAGAVFVLGHPAFYPRFGFSPASRHGIACPYDAPDEAFMLVELVPGYLRDTRGTLAYHRAFDSLGESEPPRSRA